MKSFKSLALLLAPIAVALPLTGCGPSKSELAKEIATLKEQLTQRQAESKSLQQQVASTHTELERDRKALTEAKAAAEVTGKALDETRTRLDSERKALTEAKAAAEVAGKALDETRTRLDSERKALTEAKAAAEVAGKALDETRTWLDSERKVLTEASAAAEAATRSLDQARRTQIARDARIAELERDGQQLGRKLTQLAEALDERKGELTRAAGAARRVETELRQSLDLSRVGERSAVAERDALAAELGAARGRLAALDQRLQQSSSSLVQEQTRASDLTDRLAAALREQSNLRQGTDAQRAEIAAISAALADAQAKVARLTGARGIYTVQNGDSLSEIALYFYRNAYRWPGIAHANRHLINHPDRIFPAMVLIIPK